VQARAALEKVPLLPFISRKLSEAYIEKMYRITYVSSALKVSLNQYPNLYKKYLRLARILDIRKLPDLFIFLSPEINAFAMGQNDYFIVITTGLIEHMTEDELLAIIAHELGHVKCDHLLYNNVAHILQTFGSNILDQLLPGVGGIATMGAQLALLEWSRKAEFSCDRAALLAVQDVNIVASALAKLAGHSKFIDGDEFNMAQVSAQADEYEDIGTDSLWERGIKLFALLEQTHPYPVVRFAELLRWHEGAEFRTIMEGSYERSSDDPVAPTNGIEIRTPTALMCPSCGVIAPLDAAQCVPCDRALTEAQIVCAGCRRPIESNWVSCPICGNRLQSGTKTPGAPNVLEMGKQAGNWLREKLPGNKQ
jgi:Zn-dependent protease with chaperone function